MGSSKKSHKDRKRTKRDRRSRSRSSSTSHSENEIYERRRKRPRDSREDKHDRRRSEEDERPKVADRDRKERRDTKDRDRKSERERRRSETPEAAHEKTPEEDGKEKLSMSIDETNKLRAKLGLKPLQVDVPEEKKGSSENNEVFVKTLNIGDKKEAEAFREKLRLLREKKKIKDKYQKVKGLADSDSDEDASNWIQKSRDIQKLKQEAAAREKMLMEQEVELGINDLVKKELPAKKEYSAKDLKGIEILHKQDRFKEGETVVLTLKDTGVLDDADDVLENVNIVDQEKTEKSVFNRKQGLNTYNPYDDADVDEFGIVHKKTILSKYDEELEGAKKESFKIGVNQEEDRQKHLEAIRNRLQKQKESLVLPEPTVARDYMTGEEMSAFKKPKKKVRKIRKREIMKADDLLPLADGAPMDTDHGSRNRRRRNNDDDVVGPDTDLSSIKVEDDINEEKYRSKLSKAKKIVKEEIVVQKLASQIAQIKEEPEDEVKGIAFNSSIVLNSTAEFCRTLGSVSSYVSVKEPKQEVPDDDAMDIDDEDVHVPMEEVPEDEEEKNTWSEVDPSLAHQKRKLTRTEPVASTSHIEAAPILEEEPNVAVGIAGALQLARKKGYIDEESKNKPAACKTLQELQAKNYHIEEKYYDDEGRGRRGNHYHGPVSDFKDKSHYKPDVKLDYIDDSGRLLTQKEAFRYLSHKFHGKGSGKNKIDKRQKKIEQINKLEQMSSVDTPLNTLKLLQEKQKQLQTPYIMLSGGAANALTGPSGLSKK